MPKIKLPKSLQFHLHVSQLEPGIQDYRLPWAFSIQAWHDVGNNVKDDSSNHATYFQPSDVLVLSSSHHLFRLLALFSVIRSLAIALPWMLDLWSYRRALFGGNTVFEMNIEFRCHLCCSSSMIFRHSLLQCMTIPFIYFWFSATIPLSWCLPMICVRRHNIGKCCSGYT